MKQRAVEAISLLRFALVACRGLEIRSPLMSQQSSLLPANVLALHPALMVQYVAMSECMCIDWCQW